MLIVYPNLHIVMLSSPGMGHLIPVIVLANRLAAVHNVRVTILAVTTAVAPPESKLLKLPTDDQMVNVIELPPVDISHLTDPSTKVVTQLFLMTREAMPLIRSAIAALNPRPDGLFVNLFTTEALPLAVEFGIPRYVYIATTAWFTALAVWSSVLDKEIAGQYVDERESLQIPGCKPVRPEDVVDPMLDRNDQQYFEYLRLAKEIPLFDGILLNSWEDLEATTFESLRSITKTSVYPIGPVTRRVDPDPSGSKGDVMVWLDKQPRQSVLFVSFGSGGMLSVEQTIELAWGLELSQQRFVWVVRPPTGGNPDNAFFGVKDKDSCGSGGEFLPEGFLTRIADCGVLVPMWAQQVEILGHGSIGGFFSHCGWNSTLESITSGVPMIAWPLYSEQRLNAALLVEELGVAVRPEVLPTKRVVGREEIENMVRRLMQEEEGNAMRDKVKKLKISAENALSQNGSSTKAISEVLSKINVAKKIPN